MPKIAIKTLPLEPSVRVPDIIRRLGRALEENLGLLPGQFVILWEYIPAGHFLFNGEVADTQRKDTHHPIVELTMIEGMPLAKERVMVKTVVDSLSRELVMDRSNICVCVTHLKSGKLFVSGDFKQADQISR